MGQVTNAAFKARLLEVFGTGTAVVIAPVRAISYNELLVGL